MRLDKSSKSPTTPFSLSSLRSARSLPRLATAVASLFLALSIGYTLAALFVADLNNNLSRFLNIDITPGAPPLMFGNVAYPIDMRHHAILDSFDGRPIDTSPITRFNPAILRLPHGSAWQYVGVMRLERWVTRKVHQGSVIGVGLNMTADGQYFAVSDGLMLDIPNPDPVSKGVDDARLFYSDAGTPAMTIGSLRWPGGRQGVRQHLVDDIRHAFPALDAAMAHTEGVVPRDAVVPAGWRTSKQLIRTAGMPGDMEKNWLAMYPGPKPDGKTLLPHIIYRASPFQSLTPGRSDQMSIDYNDLQTLDAAGQGQSTSCIKNIYRRIGMTGWSDVVRGSAGLSRLTLCHRSDRDCVPNEQNTVGWGILHVKNGNRYQQYVLALTTKRADELMSSFVATYSTTPPFMPLSAGPTFKIANIDLHVDRSVLLFVLSAAPVPALPASTLDKGVLPDHYFLDDGVTLAVGRNDRESLTVTGKMSDLLEGQLRCKDVA